MSSVYAQQFSHAYGLLKKDTFEQCIVAARLNLSDTTLPPYWRVKNLIIIAHASPSWNVAENCRWQGEGIYSICRRRYQESETKVRGDKEGLQELRAALDELEACQREDRTHYVPALEPDSDEDALLELLRADPAKSVPWSMADEDEEKYPFEDHEAIEAADKELLGADFEEYTSPNTTYKRRHELLGNMVARRDAEKEAKTQVEQAAEKGEQSAETKSLPLRTRVGNTVGQDSGEYGDE